MPDGFTPIFKAAGTGHRAGAVPDPGPDTPASYVLRADATWGTGGFIPLPPAPTGPGGDNLACKIAGYLVQEVVRQCFQVALNQITGVGGFQGLIFQVLDLLPFSADIIPWAVDSTVSLIERIVAGGLISEVETWLEDRLWNLIGCYVYSIVDPAVGWTQDTWQALIDFVLAIPVIPGPVLELVADFLRELGVDAANALAALASNVDYDCSACTGPYSGATGLPTGPTTTGLPLNYDSGLTVTDGGTGYVLKVGELDFVGATVTGLIGASGGTWGNIAQISGLTGATGAVGATGPAGPTGATGGALNSGCHAGNVGAGTLISGLVVGAYYTFVTTGGPVYQRTGPASPSWTFSLSLDDSTWTRVYDDSTETLIVPSWAIAAWKVDAHHAAVAFVAAQTTLYFTQEDSDYTDNSGSLCYALSPSVPGGTGATGAAGPSGPKGDTGAAGASGLLAVHTYAAGTDSFASTSSGAFGDVDATNQAITFDAPASGVVLVRVTAILATSNSNHLGFVNLREGTTNVSNSYLIFTAADLPNLPISMPFLLAGLSPGSHTLKLGWEIPGGGSSLHLFTGPTYGPTVYEVWAA